MIDPLRVCDAVFLPSGVRVVHDRWKTWCVSVGASSILYENYYFRVSWKNAVELEMMSSRWKD